MQQKQHFHPVHAVNDGVFNAASGITVSLSSPTPEMIVLDDITAALSKICRFGGHTRKFYSVAQHSCLVALIVPPPLMLEGLLHDGTEAYLGDVIKPLKVLLGETYTDLENGFQCAIDFRFGLISSPSLLLQVKEADKLAVEVEHEAFQKGNFKPFKRLLKRYGLPDDFTRCWPPDEAHARFTVQLNVAFGFRMNSKKV